MKIETWKPEQGPGRAGFWIDLGNNHRLSVQWGSGMRADNYHLLSHEIPGPSATCEVYSELFGESAEFGDPLAYVPVNKIMELLGRLACVNTPALWQATAQAWLKELRS